MTEGCNKAELEKITGTANRWKFFDKSQEGGMATAIIWEAHLIWENGSYRELGDGNVGIMADATWLDPDDFNEVRENLCYQKIFAQQKLEDAVKYFECARDALNQQVTLALDSGNLPPEKEALKEIKVLRSNVRKWSKKLDKILDKLNPVPEEIEYTEDELERMEVNRNDATNFLEALGEIQI